MQIRSNFLSNLAFSLIESHLRRRIEQRTLRTSIKKLIGTVLRIEIPVQSTLSMIRENTRARCSFCDSDAGGRTRMKCPNCSHRICDNHRSALCTECERLVD